MKKLLILTAVGMLTVSSLGCRACEWLWRGSAIGNQGMAMPACCPDPCDPCGGAMAAPAAGCSSCAVGEPAVLPYGNVTPGPVPAR